MSGTFKLTVCSGAPWSPACSGCLAGSFSAKVPACTTKKYFPVCPCSGPNKPSSGTTHRTEFWQTLCTGVSEGLHQRSIEANWSQASPGMRCTVGPTVFREMSASGLTYTTSNSTDPAIDHPMKNGRIVECQHSLVSQLGITAPHSPTCGMRISPSETSCRRK